MPEYQHSFRVIALVVAFALFMQQLDATVLTIALPAMARDFDVAASSLSIALTAYLVALAVFIPASGRLADHYGSRTVFCTAMAVFMGGSIGCAQSGNLLTLVVARFIQGMGGAMMVPVGRLILLRSVRREDLVAALSWLVMPALIGPILGPPLGGFIVSYLDWRWIFYINIPIGAVGLVLAWWLIPQVKDEKASRFDTTGFILSGMALGCLVFGLELASRALPVQLIIGLLGGSATFALVYLWHMRRVEHPILDLSLMRIPTFGLSVMAGTLTRIAQGAQPFLLPLLFQIAFGLSAAKSGTIMMASAVGALAMKPIAPYIIQRYGYRNSLTVASVAASIACGSCAFFNSAWPPVALIAILFASGFFMSFLFTGYNAIAFVDVDQTQMSAATSLYATCQQLSLSLGICFAASILEFGGSIAAGSITQAFLIVSVVSVGAAFVNHLIRSDAGT